MGCVQLTAVEAVLEPGDTLFFPPGWAHYTESLDLSVSMTYRFGPKRPATARLVQALDCFRSPKRFDRRRTAIRCGSLESMVLHKAG